MDAAEAAAPAPEEPTPIAVDPPTDSAPQAPPSAEPRVQLGKYSVPVKWALSWARPDCRNCNGKGCVVIVGRHADGIQIEVLPGENRRSVLCGCAQGRAESRLAAYLRPPRAIDPPPPTADPRESKRIATKQSNLRRQLEDLEAELAGRRQRFDRTMEGHRGEHTRARITEQDTASKEIVAKERADRLAEQISAAEADLARKKEALKGLCEEWAAAKAERTRALAIREAKEEILRRAEGEWAKNTAGLVKEISRARRRLDLALARGGEPGVVPDEVMP